MVERRIDNRFSRNITKNLHGIYYHRPRDSCVLTRTTATSILGLSRVYPFESHVVTWQFDGFPSSHHNCHMSRLTNRMSAWEGHVFGLTNRVFVSGLSEKARVEGFVLISWILIYLESYKMSGGSGAIMLTNYCRRNNHEQKSFIASTLEWETREGQMTMDRDSKVFTIYFNHLEVCLSQELITYPAINQIFEPAVHFSKDNRRRVLAKQEPVWLWQNSY